MLWCSSDRFRAPGFVALLMGSFILFSARTKQSRKRPQGKPTCRVCDWTSSQSFPEMPRKQLNAVRSPGNFRCRRHSDRGDANAQINKSLVISFQYELRWDCTSSIYSYRTSHCDWQPLIYTRGAHWRLAVKQQAQRDCSFKCVLVAWRYCWHEASDAVSASL